MTDQVTAEHKETQTPHAPITASQDAHPCPARSIKSASRTETQSGGSAKADTSALLCAARWWWWWFPATIKQQEQTPPPPTAPETRWSPPRAPDHPRQVPSRAAPSVQAAHQETARYQRTPISVKRPAPGQPTDRAEQTPPEAEPDRHAPSGTAQTAASPAHKQTAPPGPRYVLRLPRQDSTDPPDRSGPARPQRR